MKKLLPFLKLLIFVLLSVSLTGAQEACEALLSDALTQIGDNCNTMGNNEACYGFQLVKAAFLSSTEPDFFTSPSDTASVSDMVAISTSRFNVDTGEWGIAIMNLQANLPNTLPGQNVTFILLGDVEVENAVPPAMAFRGNDGIEVIVNVQAVNLRRGPSDDFIVVGGASEGDILIADGLSQNGEWLRVVHNNHPAWINRSVLAENSASNRLPIISDALRTPMQSFYLRTGLGQTDCEDAPENILFVQGPDEITIHLTVNGANITLGSSGALRIIEIEGESFLEIMVFDGTFTVENVTIQAGQHSLVCLGQADSYGLDGEANDLVMTCDPTSPEMMTPSASLCALEGLPSDLLNYPLDVLCPGEIIAGGNSDGGLVTHGSDSQIEGVDCSDFAIMPTSIVNGNFTLEWTTAEGATRYEIVTFDQDSNQQHSLLQTNGTSIGVNGGESFPPTGYVDVRAYRGNDYACYTRLNYQRINNTSDTSSIPASNPNCTGGGTYTITIINNASCDMSGSFGGAPFSVNSGSNTVISVSGGNNSVSASGACGSVVTSYCISTDTTWTLSD